MAQIYKKLEIDVYNAITPIATAVQNDSNSRFLDVVLLNGSTPIDLTGHEVRIYCKKPEEGGEVFNDGVITEPINGRCQFPLTDQTLSKVGYVEAQIVMYYNNVQILQTVPFQINVVKSLISNNAISSSNEYGALVILFQNIYEAHALMTTMVQNQGEKGVISTDRNINTFWESMEYVSKYLDTDLTNLLNAVLQEANVQGVIDRLGNTTDTGATATAGTVMGKLNKLIGCIGIKSVQSGNIATGDTSGQIVIPINPVNLQKSLVLINTTYKSDSSTIKFFELTNDALVLTCQGTNSTGVYSTWQVIEFY